MEQERRIEDILRSMSERNAKEEEELQEETAEEVSSEVITIHEEDEESGAMFFRQRQYEEELENLPEDHPKRLFPHNFLRSQYLPVVTVSAKKTEEADFDLVAEEMKAKAYDENAKGTLKLNQMKFCMLWKKNFDYVYSGNILTPNGAIDPEEFRHELMTMLFTMETECTNLDLLVDRLYKTYITAYKIDAYREQNKIPFRNGDLVLNPDKKSFTFYEGCRSAVPYRFDYDFRNIPNCEEPEFPNFKTWLDGLFELEDQYTLKQMLGYLLIPSNEAQEAFFIVGKGGSGKSILTDCIIPKMLGRAMFPISVGTFFNDKFQVGTSEGKLCMVDDDIGETNLTKADSGRFKNFVTAKKIQIEHKYCNPTTTINSARIVCSGNHMINSDDKTDGFTRRLHPIYAKPRTIEKVDRRFPQKIEREIEMIVLWALEGLLEMLSHDGAPFNSEKTNTNFENYAESQKWEEQFVNDCFCYKDNTVTYSQDIKNALAEWSKDNEELCGEGSLTMKFRAVTSWLRDEGSAKNGYIYRRGIRRGEKYNARGYINMALKAPVSDPTVFIDEQGNTKIKIRKSKPEEQEGIDDIE